MSTDDGLGSVMISQLSSGWVGLSWVSNLVGWVLKIGPTAMSAGPCRPITLPVGDCLHSTTSEDGLREV